MSNFEQVFKNIDDALYKDAGADSELDYIEQTSWVLFMKYLEDLEQTKKDEAELTGEKYEPMIEDKYLWSNWAKIKDEDGKSIDKEEMKGDDLLEFVNKELFPALAKLEDLNDRNSIKHKLGIIFKNLENKIKSGYVLRSVIDQVDQLEFKSSKKKHQLSELYETKIKNMGNAGRNGGQYYTPRPLIRAMIEVVDPKIGETIYDGACGSAGFLVESYDYLKPKAKNTKQREKLDKNTLYGQEKKNLAFIIGLMNMILHGIQSPNIEETNTLAVPLSDITREKRHDIVLANPPFGGKERKEVQTNFDIKTSETAFLFLQHFIRILKTPGRAAIVIKNTFLSNMDRASVALRKELLTNCNLHTILDMPAGTFQGAGVQTVVLFFDKGETTKNIWYYQLDPGRSLGKTNPLNDKDLEEFVKLQKKKPETERSWNVDVTKFTDEQKKNYDLSVRNPNLPEEDPLRKPSEILKEMAKLDKKTAKLIDSVKELI